MKDKEDEVISGNLIRMAIRYKRTDILQLYNLIDYLSEIGLSSNSSEFPEEKSICDIIDEFLSKKILYEPHSSSSHPGDYKMQVQDFFDKYSAAPEIFMENLIGRERWNNQKERMENRRLIDKVYYRNLIKTELMD